MKSIEVKEIVDGYSLKCGGFGCEVLEKEGKISVMYYGEFPARLRTTIEKKKNIFVNVSFAKYFILDQFRKL